MVGFSCQNTDITSVPQAVTITHVPTPYQLGRASDWWLLPAISTTYNYQETY